MPPFDSISVPITQEDIDYAAQFENPCPLSEALERVFPNFSFMTRIDAPEEAPVRLFCMYVGRFREIPEIPLSPNASEFVRNSRSEKPIPQDIEVDLPRDVVERRRVELRLNS